MIEKRKKKKKKKRWEREAKSKENDFGFQVAMRFASSSGLDVLAWDSTSQFLALAVMQHALYLYCIHPHGCVDNADVWSG
jgi:hypothetical protein